MMEQMWPEDASAAAVEEERTLAAVAETGGLQDKGAG